MSTPLLFVGATAVFLAVFAIAYSVQSIVTERRQAYRTLQAIRATEPWVYGIDLAVGSVIVGTALGLGIAALTWASVAHAPPLAPHLTRLFDAAAGRFLDVGVTAWEIARAKLRRDPIYAAALTTLPRSGATLVDVGCGRGLALAVLVEAAAAVSEGDWPADRPPPPHFDRLMGIEIRGRVAAIARRALAPASRLSTTPHLKVCHHR